MAVEHAGTCLFVNNSPEPGRGQLAKLGGGGHSLLGLVETLPHFGWGCHVVVPADGPLTEELKSRGIAHTIFPYRIPSWNKPGESLQDFFHWKKIIRTNRPDIIHANAPGLHRSFAVPARLAQVPFVSHFRFPMEEGAVRWMCRTLPKPDGFIFNSGSLRDAMWPVLARHCAGAQDFIVHNAVDLTAFTPAPWPDTPCPRIGIIGNLLPIKRHQDFLHMAAELTNQGFQAEYWIAGDDTEGKGHRVKLRKLAADLGLNDQVKFLGHRPDIPDIMRQLHLVVVTSQYESFGRVLIEAMACGRPVISTRTGGIPEVVRAGETGFLLDVGDHKGMAKAARNLLSDRPKWERMSLSAQHDARTRFSLDQHARNIIDAYSVILCGNGARITRPTP